MKFKIKDRFWPNVHEYLKNSYEPVSFSYIQDHENGEFVIEVKQTTRFDQTISEKLLLEFNKQKIINQTINLSSWITDYAKNLKSYEIGEEVVSSYLSYCLQLREYNQLKRSILEKQGILRKLLEENKKLMENYEEEGQLDEKKAQLGIKNIQLRIEGLQKRDEQEIEELQRIKNVIKNGIWGMSNQIQQKIKRIQTVSSEINQFKKRRGQ